MTPDLRDRHKIDGYSVMKIQDYIKKHELTLWRTWPVNATLQTSWMPAFFITQKINGKFEPFPHDEKIEIYANADKSRFVSINTARGIFKIVHHEMIVIESEWQPMQPNYELQGLF